MSDYYTVPCDEERADDHIGCERCYGTKSVSIVSEHTRDQFLQWALGTLLVIVAGLTIAAVWLRQ